jgi:outer membrane receptor protein involved in Fe transport
MNRLKFLTAIWLFLALSGVKAQQGPGGGQMEMPSNGIIGGKVVDDSGNPVEYATISLMSLRDSTIVSGAISGIDGSFKMTNLKLGVYCMNIKVLGYETKRINPIYLMPKGRGKGEGTEQDFGSIALGNSDVKLDDVTIVGEKSRVQYKIDKKVINPSQDIGSTTGSAVEILQNTPSVTVDIDGNVQLRGSGNFTVLIDGKPSVLSGSEALQQIPANLVENIEIITNPSAKFDPEGAAGIINIILKKKKTLGLTGLVNVSVGTNDKYRGSITLANRIGKIGYSAGFDYRDEKRYGSGYQEREIYGNDATYYMRYDGTRDMDQYSMGFNGGIDYFINDKNTLSISGRYNDRDFSHLMNSYYHEWSSPATTDSYYLRRTESGFGGKSYNLSVDYNLKLAKPEQKLDFSFTYSNRDGVRKNNQSRYLTNALNQITDTNPELSKADDTGPSDDYRFKIDFVSPLGTNGILEAGYQGRYEIENENYIYSDFNPSTNLWVIDNLKSNYINFTENIQAIYTTYAGKMMGFDYKFGLRGEYNNRILEQISTGDDFAFEKFDLFPSAYITRQLSKTQQIQLNYSRRVNRPNGRQLDPFVDYSDPKNLRTGNPKLNPEYVDSYELNFQQQISKSFISLETYYRRTNNLITNVSYLQQGDVMLRTFENMNHDNALGVELNANMFLAKWWRLNASGSAFYYQIDGVIDGRDITNESFNYNFRFDNSFTFKTNTRLQITGFYMGPSVTAQGKTKASFFTNIAVRHDFMKGKMTATAQLQDIFGAFGWRYTEETENYKSTVNFVREARVLNLSLSYRLNNFKQKRNGERTGDDMDMEMGM